MRVVGWLLIPLLLGAVALGFRLGRRYRAATQHTGIGRPYPLKHSLLAFLGDALVLLGLIGLMLDVMLTFF